MDSQMNFLTAEEFAEYYWSTLLWRESTEGFTREQRTLMKTRPLMLLEQKSEFALHKPLCCLKGLQG